MTFGELVAELRERKDHRLRGKALFDMMLNYDISWLLEKDKRMRGGPRFPLSRIPIDTLSKLNQATLVRIPNVGKSSVGHLRVILKEYGFTDPIPMT